VLVEKEDNEKQYPCAGQKNIVNCSLIYGVNHPSIGAVLEIFSLVLGE
jgi:hypothetical protein